MPILALFQRQCGGEYGRSQSAGITVPLLITVFQKVSLGLEIVGHFSPPHMGLIMLYPHDRVVLKIICTSFDSFFYKKEITSTSGLWYFYDIVQAKNLDGA